MEEHRYVRPVVSDVALMSMSTKDTPRVDFSCGLHGNQRQVANSPHASPMLPHRSMSVTRSPLPARPVPASRQAVNQQYGQLDPRNKQGVTPQPEHPLARMMHFDDPMDFYLTTSNQDVQNVTQKY